MKIGIFDSGIGGEAIAREIRKSFPDTDILTINDRKNLPYGEKTQQEVIELTDKAIQPFLKNSYEIIVIACNTATALAIDSLRKKYPNQKFIGIEPMVKTASTLTKSNIIAVCATPGTLRSKRYNILKEQFASGITIVEPDCSSWAYLIENNQLNSEQIKNTIEEICQKNADVIVLGCTHYHWIKETVEQLASGRAIILEPSEAISRRIKSLLGSQIFNES